MAKMPDQITVTLDPEIMDLIRDLRATVDVYVAHTENLIERVYALEGGGAPKDISGWNVMTLADIQPDLVYSIRHMIDEYGLAGVRNILDLIEQE